jgi:hypothetical protein
MRRPYILVASVWSNPKSIEILTYKTIHVLHRKRWFLEHLQRLKNRISISIIFWQNRAVSPTTQNAVSSRSHAFLTFFIERTTQEVPLRYSICCLFFVILCLSTPVSCYLPCAVCYSPFLALPRAPHVLYRERHAESLQTIPTINERCAKSLAHTTLNMRAISESISNMKADVILYTVLDVGSWWRDPTSSSHCTCSP